MQSNAFATKALIDDNESCVEDCEQKQRQNEHEDVVQSVEVDQLVREAVVSGT